MSSGGMAFLAIGFVVVFGAFAYIAGEGMGVLLSAVVLLGLVGMLIFKDV